MADSTNTKRSPVCGLDFGTTNSVVATIQKGLPCLLDLEDDKPIIPTTIFFDSDARQPFFGDTAIRRYLAGANGRMLWAPKNILGSGLMDDATYVDGRLMEFASILALIVRNLRERAGQSNGAPLENVVIGRPVHYNDTDSALDRKAERLMRAIAITEGFRQVEFQFEPIAAAYEYERTLAHEQLALVVDMGGGTSDFSVVRLGSRNEQSERVRDILAIGGVHIGGTGFDSALSVRAVMPALGMGVAYRSPSGQVLTMPSSIFYDLAEWSRIHAVYGARTTEGVYDILGFAKDSDRRLQLLDRTLTYKLGHYVARSVEMAKVNLSQSDAGFIYLDDVSPGLNIPVTRAFFEAAIDRLVVDVEKCIHEVLRNAAVLSADIDAVILTGGSTAIPLIRERIALALPTAKLVDIDRFGAVGKGLAITAHERFEM